MPPKVSVLMACYNSEKTLERSIESILNQTFKNYEFVIVDDCSSDKTLAVIKRFAKRDNRIIVLKNKKNKGLAYSLNFAFRNSSGSLIARMDADDYAVLSRLETQVDHFSKNSNLSVLGSSAYYYHYSNGAKITKLVNMPLKHNDITSFMYKSSPFIHPTIMMTFEFYKTVGGYNESLRRAQDYDLWLRARKFAVFENLPQPLLFYHYDIEKSHRSIFRTFALKMLSNPSLNEILVGALYSGYEVLQLIKFKIKVQIKKIVTYETSN